MNKLFRGYKMNKLQFPKLYEIAFILSGFYMYGGLSLLITGDYIHSLVDLSISSAFYYIALVEKK